MNALGENKLHPLQIEDAREAAHEASKKQREVEDAIRDASRNLAEAERQYRLKLTERILHLHAQDGVAWTMCGEIARGEKAVADLRYARDVAKGILEAALQQGFRRGADRKDVHRLLAWSEGREMRTDVEPMNWSRQTTYGTGRPPGVDPQTGELQRAA